MVSRIIAIAALLACVGCVGFHRDSAHPKKYGWTYDSDLKSYVQKNPAGVIINIAPVLSDIFDFK